MLVGDGGIGKTCLRDRYVDGTYFEHPVPFDLKMIEESMGGETIRVVIWDHHRPRGCSVRAGALHSFRSADGVMLCYDISNMASFQTLASLLQEVEDHAREGVKRMLVGLKSDGEREVSSVEAQEFAHAHNMLLEEVSARNNENVSETFRLFVGNICYGTRMTWSPAIHSLIKKPTRDQIEMVIMAFRCRTPIPREIAFRIVSLAFTAVQILDGRDEEPVLPKGRMCIQC